MILWLYLSFVDNGPHRHYPLKKKKTHKKKKKKKTEEKRNFDSPKMYEPILYTNYPSHLFIPVFFFHTEQLQIVRSRYERYVPFKYN